MSDDTAKIQTEPAEGDRGTIERELARTQTEKETQEADKRTIDPSPVKSFDPKVPKQRMFGNGDTDR
ncbi:hypothetical protein D3C87_2116210 [compost metagenome]